MKILRAAKDGQTFYAVLEGERARRISGLPFGQISYTGQEYERSSLKLLAPCEPSKVVAVGLNYAKHAGEMNEALPEDPVIFIKPPTAVIGSGDAIAYPADAGRVDYEAELAAVIGKTCRNVSETQAPEYVFGYTALNDVTARDLQKKDGQWTRAKSFDTFCPLGPVIDTDFDPSGRRVKSVLCGVVMQDGNTGDMRYSVAALVAFISRCMTLMPGDVVATGTPEGIGPMQRGDMIAVED